ncbi:FMRFamide receptor [Diorhabda carinulata]|uniref:FMRFamide receptor n=1 Tax=Diorhabda carinulata TaxID=1163345 RepID=UPI0025A21ECE|nr:FMRFamide receptor [Diorhabda carinulata]XP_057663038.1 FMRFamide receptor [Diorhabda carinulata]XP_057663039.1 FMRFamide receptor [Diorhabda carinulata]XP_057663040.1 FMRFamide receptor [Diorhabda carinulata]XP_057663041.1 FMRFamide receptor [Diorhabda carinulata]XP_057663042.1 FMRFamide receptor [Diorhabda carinulata]
MVSASIGESTVSLNVSSSFWPIKVANPNDSNFQSCLMAEDSDVFFQFVVNGLFMNLIGVLGVLGNIISMIILSRPQMRSSINYLLIGLARVDTVLIITSMLLFGLPGIYPYSGMLFTYFYVVLPHIAPVVFPLATVVQTASVYLTVTVSLERFVAVCHPLRARSLCTYGRARIYVVGIIIFSAMYNLPKLWETTVQKEISERDNITVYCLRESELRGNETYIHIYIHWLYLICMYLVPFVSLAVLNACIYRQVLRANKERQRLSRHQKREIGLATMLLGVVVVFFFCNLLPLVINIIETFRVDIPFSLEYLLQTSNLLVTINSSVNFIIYVIFGEKFKRLFLILFCNNNLFRNGRESPEGVTHEDSLISNGDRQSLRLHRQSTTVSRNGAGSINFGRSNGSTRQPSNRGSCRYANPGPCVYYPANRNNKEISQTTVLIED